MKRREKDEEHVASPKKQKLDESKSEEPSRDVFINPIKEKSQFRNYVDSARQRTVAKLYDEQHRSQTYDFVEQQHKRWCGKNFGKFKKGVWDMLNYLTKVIDDSDPDTNLSQLDHALQTAESCRRAFPNEDWLHLTGLIHDLGKVMSVTDSSLNLQALPQWAVVGDTFPVGCAFQTEHIVMPESFKDNPDSKNDKYNTRYGIYKKPKVGLDNIRMSWGHDEYLYQVLVHNKCKLPEPALYIVRYHSFYPLHQRNAYLEFCNDKDMEMLGWIRKFNGCDLYSKSETPPNFEELASYYKSLIRKYLHDDDKPFEW